MTGAGAMPGTVPGTGGSTMAEKRCPSDHAVEGVGAVQCWLPEGHPARDRASGHEVTHEGVTPGGTFVRWDANGVRLP